MTYALLAICAVFAAFAVTVGVMSAVVRPLGSRLARRLVRYSPASRARALFGLRALPAIAASAAAFAVVLPIFLWFEPRDTDEPLSRTIAVLAAIGLAVMLRGGLRGLRAWRATRRISRAWQRSGRRLHGVDAPLPTFAIDVVYPTVAVAGVSRPVLFIAERVLADLSAGEIRAIVAHECAHVRASDNLKRLFLRASPDLLGPACVLNGAWAAAAEEAADAAAVESRPSSGLDLAHALIRVARLAPSPAPELASAFHQGGDIAGRVRRLIDPPPPRDFGGLFGARTLCMMVILLGAGVLMAAPSLHQLMEAALRVLP